MPQVTITIGGRNFEVACQDGEEQFLHNAAGMLDTEAQTLAKHVGRLPESKMLLMAGLMLADRTANVESKIQQAEAQIAQLQAELNAAQNAEPQRIEVPVVPSDVTDTLAELAAQAEALAESLEERIKA